MDTSNEKVEELISDETNKAWNNDSEHDLVAFVQDQIEEVSQPLTQAQLTALTKALTFVTKATTKNTIITLINVINRIQSGQM